MRLEKKIFEQDSNHVLATYGATVLAVWRGQGSYDNWRAESNPMFEHIATFSPHKVLMLVVVEATAELPSATARKELDELAWLRSPIILGTSVVTFGSAARIGAVRAAATAINIFSKARLRVFTELDQGLDALAVLAREHDIPFDKAEALTITHTLRKR